MSGAPSQLDRLRTLLVGRHRGVLVTIGPDGRPQLSNLDYVFSPEQAVLRISTTAGRVKVRNIARDARVSLHTTTSDGSAWVVADGLAELSPVAAATDDPAVEELIEVYRAIQGEHRDWADYRAAMVADRRLVIRIAVRRLYGMVAPTPVMDAFSNTITPVLTVRNAVQAVDFYKRALGAEEVYRNTYPDGKIVAEMTVGDARFRVADEAPEASNLSPHALDGTSVRLNLLVADPDGLADRAIANGAVQVSPVADQASYGLRQGRLADPYGHHWLVGRPLNTPEGEWARQPIGPAR